MGFRKEITKQKVDLIFKGRDIVTVGKSSSTTLEVGNIESFINSLESAHLSAHLDNLNQTIAMIGMANNSIDWWCFNAATRNPLSSRFIYTYLAFKCCVDKIEDTTRETKLILKNVPDTIKFAIAKYYGKRIPIRDRIAIFAKDFFSTLIGMARLTIQLYQIWCFSSRRPPKNLRPGCTGLVTFIDGSNRQSGDPYFGDLAKLLAKEIKDTTVEHLAYVYRPYSKYLDESIIDLPANYSILLSYLKFSDYVKTWIEFICMFMFSPLPHLAQIPACDKSFSTILKYILKSELSRGAQENYLIYRASVRICKSGIFSRIIYPFENKALEKCLLMGLAGSPALKKIGYQHTSITKRHYALQLVADEFELIPMPDRIVTVGDVTRNWLLKHGFSSDKVRSGCSFRHKLDFSSNNQMAGESPRILFALSSSKYELESIVSFMKALNEFRSDWELGLRCHPNFPSSLLGEHDRAWLKSKIIEFTGSSLADNLEWADILGYVSSTVALEALASGLFVIRLNIEALNADPLLDPPPFFKECHSVDEFINAVDKLRTLDIESRKETVTAARSYVRSYLKPYNQDFVRQFVI